MKSRTIKIVLPILLILTLCTGAYFLYDRGRPAPVPIRQKLYEGITYRRLVQVLPHPMIAHVLVIDTRTNGLEFLVTPPDSQGEQPLKARTTSQFLEEFNLQIAINGGGFSPWWSRSPADYYPHIGDPIVPAGFTASDGKTYWVGSDTPKVEPTLYISRKNVISFNNQPSRVYNAISGDRMLVLKGEVAPDLDDERLNPRTAVGTNKSGRYLYMMVVDGRQPFYSEGATFVHLAELMIDQGAYTAMSFDGGGSSTMVIEGDHGAPRVMNSPIDNYIPGRERPVGTHLGVYVNP